MNSFLTSTQNKNWIKTEEQLKKIEKNKIKKILERINDVNSLIKKENEELKSRFPNSEQNFQKYISEKNLLSLTDEKTLIINYSNKLIKILNSLSNISTSLKNYVISYFRRFYLKKSILDYDPSFLMAAAFLLGKKIAAVNYTMDEFAKIFPIIRNNLNKFLEYEFFLCTILEYDFFVYNPFQALLGFIYTLEQKGFFLTQNMDNYINQDDFKNECMNIIDEMFLTDNIFLYTYSEIALGSIFILCGNKNINIINIAEKLNLDKIINIKEFMEKQVSDMKKKLEEIPKYESIEEEEKKSNEIYKNVRHFLKNFPKYQAQLDLERINLKNKMDEFEKNFREMECEKKDK
jgi:cyclin H